MPSEFRRSERPVIVAHRGGALEAPENTLAAIRHAVACGSDWIEIDVRLTADAQLVVFHDDTLERITGGHEAVRDLTLEQLRQFDVGNLPRAAEVVQALSLLGVESPDFADHFVGERIPTLAEVLAVDGARLMIELKRGPGESVDPLVDAVIEQLSATEHDVVIASFDLEILDALQRRESDLRVMGLAESIEQLQVLMDLDLAIVGPRVDILHHAVAAVGKRERDFPSGIAIWTWTIYEERLARAALSLGADGLITDTPARLIARF